MNRVSPEDLILEIKEGTVGYRLNKRFDIGHTSNINAPAASSMVVGTLKTSLGNKLDCSIPRNVRDFSPKSSMEITLSGVDRWRSVIELWAGGIVWR